MGVGLPRRGGTFAIVAITISGAAAVCAIALGAPNGPARIEHVFASGPGGGVARIPPPPAVIPAPDAAPGTPSTWTGDRLEVIREQVVVPFETRTVSDPSLAVGSTEIETEGAQGQAMVDKEVFVDQAGNRVAEHILRQQIVVDPVASVVRVGSRPLVVVSPGSTPEVSHQVISGTATSYCLTGTTATGTQAGPGAIAVDPAVIPLGSHLYVSGYGYGYAVDTGGLIHGSLIDLWNTCDDAIQWGRRPVTIYVLG
ncbi:MAG TPA: 3D domain-containing protein [Candidatus Dormibacteraeota bacterium]|nr:3D domain-containing protein [Candidatus Dormibacteraeota bacterium]